MRFIKYSSYFTLSTITSSDLIQIENIDKVERMLNENHNKRWNLHFRNMSYFDSK